MKNRKKVITGILLLCVAVAVVLMCRNSFGVHKKQIFAMDTSCSIEVKGGGEKLLSELEEIIVSYDEKYNAYSTDSEAYRLNKNGESPDAETVALAKELMEYNRLTEGAYDFSLKKLSDLWGFYKKDVKEPEDIYFSTFGADKVEITDDKVILNGVEADFGGVMKGYVTDKLHEKLEKKGITEAVINLGVNVLALGSCKVGIQNPEDKNSLLCAVSVTDKAVVTSGIYQRTFSDQNGIMRHHILNPETGYPADSGVVSVTVIGENATLCDVLSTAYLVLGREKTAQLCKQFDAEIIMLLNNTVYCSEKIADSVEVYDGYYKEVL